MIVHPHYRCHGTGSGTPRQETLRGTGSPPLSGTATPGPRRAAGGLRREREKELMKN